VNIADVTIADMHTSAAGTAPLSVANEGLDADSAPTGDSTDTTANDGSWDLLGVNDTLTFTSTYVVTAADISAGDPITNTATANGTPPGGTLAPPSATESVELANAIVAVDNILVVPIDSHSHQVRRCHRVSR